MPKRLRRSAVDDVGEEVPPEAKPGVEWGRRGSQNVPDGDVCGLGSPSPFRAAPALVDDRSPHNSHHHRSTVARRPLRSGMYSLMWIPTGVENTTGMVLTALSTTIPVSYAV